MNVDYSKLKFVFKPKASTKRRAPTVLPNKKLTKLVPGQVIQDEQGNYTVHIKFVDYINKLTKDTVISDIGKDGITIPFTEDSYDLSKCERIFTTCWSKEIDSILVYFLMRVIEYSRKQTLIVMYLFVITGFVLVGLLELMVSFMLNSIEF